MRRALILATVGAAILTLSLLVWPELVHDPSRSGRTIAGIIGGWLLFSPVRHWLFHPTAKQPADKREARRQWERNRDSQLLR